MWRVKDNEVSMKGEWDMSESREKGESVVPPAVSTGAGGVAGGTAAVAGVYAAAAAGTTGGAVITSGLAGLGGIIGGGMTAGLCVLAAAPIAGAAAGYGAFRLYKHCAKKK